MLGRKVALKLTSGNISESENRHKTEMWNSASTSRDDES